MQFIMREYYVRTKIVPFCLAMKTDEQAIQHSTFSKEEHSDYQETTRRIICHIFHSMPRRNVEMKREKRSCSQGVLLWSLLKLSHSSGQEILCQRWKCMASSLFP
jgi:hypothetical protein